MVSLLLTLLVVGVIIGGLLAAGSYFFQGYFYTEPNPGIPWQAPAAAGVLSVFLLLWCLLNTNTPGASSTNIPYDTLFAFHSQVEMYPEPVKTLWTIKKGIKEPIKYQREKVALQQAGRVLYVYKDTTPLRQPWNPTDVEAVLVEYKGEKIRFEPVQNVAEGDHLEFVSPEGWRMQVFNRMITGEPTRSSWGYFSTVLFLNFLHLGLWFVCLWLLLRFQWPHALLFAVILWVAATLSFVPMLLAQASNLAPEPPPEQTQLVR